MDRGTWWATVHGVAKSQTRPYPPGELVLFLEESQSGPPARGTRSNVTGWKRRWWELSSWDKSPTFLLDPEERKRGHAQGQHKRSGEM